MSYASPLPDPAEHQVVMPTSLPLRLDPLWRAISQDCSQRCLSELREHLAPLFQVADVLDELGRSRLRDFIRCVGRMHERAERAEAAAYHWQSQWDHAFGHALAQRQVSENASIASQTEMCRLRDELNAVRADRDRLVQELFDMQETIRSTSLARIAQKRARDQQLRHVEDVSWRCLGTSEEEKLALVRHLDAEKAVSRGLKAQLHQMSMELAAERADKARMQRASTATELYALDTRSNVRKAIDEALGEQSAAFEQERVHLKRRISRAVEPPKVLAILALQAELWRCASSAHVGLHTQRAEAAARELLRATSLLTPECDLVQEPLRRAMGDSAAIHLGRAMANEQDFSGTFAEGTEAGAPRTLRSDRNVPAQPSIFDPVEGDQTLRLRSFVRQQQEKILCDSEPLRTEGCGVALRHFLPLQAQS